MRQLHVSLPCVPTAYGVRSACTMRPGGPSPPCHPGVVFMRPNTFVSFSDSLGPTPSAWPTVAVCVSLAHSTIFDLAGFSCQSSQQCRLSLPVAPEQNPRATTLTFSVELESGGQKILVKAITQEPVSFTDPCLILNSVGCIGPSIEAKLIARLHSQAFA